MIPPGADFGIMLGLFSGRHMRLISGGIIALGQHYYVFVVNKLHWPFRVGQAVALSPPGSCCPDLVRAVVCSSYRKYFSPFRLDNYRYKADCVSRQKPVSTEDHTGFHEIRKLPVCYAGTDIIFSVHILRPVYHVPSIQASAGRH